MRDRFLQAADACENGCHGRSLLLVVSLPGVVLTGLALWSAWWLLRTKGRPNP
jgi:hypothetical protein